MGVETDIWDDSALVNALDDAICRYKTIHSKAYHDNSTEGGKAITTAEDTSDRIDESHEDSRQTEVHDNDNAISNTAIDVGKANDLPQIQESYHAISHAKGVFMHTSNVPYTQNALDGFSYSQDVGEYTHILSQYYELEEQRQKVLQQLHQAGYWNNQDIGKGSGSSTQWVACSTSQEQHQVPTHQSSLPGMPSSCCPYVCPCLVAPCSSLPCCASSGTCVSNIGTDVGTASCMMGTQKSSSLEDDGVIKTAIGAAESAISSLKMKKIDASTIHEEREKDGKKGSSLSEGEMVQCMNSDTDLGVVLHAWYSAGFYTGKYLKEQSKKGQQGNKNGL
ncbi:hypothetical protein NE237_026381 [Protea cynaroides]|uniref:Survival Motor Neuron Gemin2-binding domain-containing protein n=1 Tax=Protea cynaroides TaxID=273540 RepID=A0A9Q0K284_9MAGN|nr:hypothetical protein NE237_026381 [Protea cynaroides]